MSIAVLIASEFVSTVLALILVYFLFKIYKFTRYLYLLGLLIGFLLLVVSYILLGMYLFYENNAVISEQFLWARLIVQGYGYAFIAFAYHFSRKSEKATRFYFVLILLFCVISIVLFFVALIVAPPFLELPSVVVAGGYFRVLNLIFMGYVIYHVINHFDFSHEGISGLKWTVLAFSMLWLAEYSMLIWGIDGSQTAFVLAHLARLASLTLFIFIYCFSGRVKNESREAR